MKSDLTRGSMRSGSIGLIIARFANSDCSRRRIDHRMPIVADICSLPTLYDEVRVCEANGGSAGSGDAPCAAHDTHVARQYVDRAANKIHGREQGPLDSCASRYRDEDGWESRSDLRQLLDRQIQYVY